MHLGKETFVKGNWRTGYSISHNAIKQQQQMELLECCLHPKICQCRVYLTQEKIVNIFTDSAVTFHFSENMRFYILLKKDAND